MFPITLLVAINANKEIFPIKWRENYEFNAHPPKPNI